MPATFLNMLFILLGSGLGLLFQNLISGRLLSILTHALGLCVLSIGVSGAIGTENMLCVIVCMVVGTVAGNAIDIERRLEEACSLTSHCLKPQTDFSSAKTGLKSWRQQKLTWSQH